jgi:hypothetical protein
MVNRGSGVQLSKVEHFAVGSKSLWNSVEYFFILSLA